MRVAIVTDKFQPGVNPGCSVVQQLATELRRSGHRPLIIAPGRGPLMHGDVPVVRNRSVVLPGVRSVPLNVPGRAVEHTLEGFAPDVVHLASPLSLGALGLNAARRLGIAVVADYQTDVSRTARRHGPVHAGIDHWVARLHRRCDRTLVPSRGILRRLEAERVPELHLWSPGVDVELFNPGRHSTALYDTWQRAVGGGGHRAVVGYVGPLVGDDHLRVLTELSGIAGTGLVVVGDGLEHRRLKERLPETVFTGPLHGEQLASTLATLDVVVHVGRSDTFCSVVQDCQASGTAVIASAVGGSAELVDHRRTGLLYDPSDRASLRRSVARLAWDRQLRRSLAAAAYAETGARSWPRAVEELTGRHYAEAIEANSSRTSATRAVLSAAR